MPKEKQTRDPVAAALESVALSNLAIATALASNAETNAVLAGQMERLTNSVRGVQGKLTSEIGPMIERHKKQAAEMLAEVEARRFHADR